MKKYLLFMIMTLIAVLALPVSAGAPTEYEIPEIGTEINGFKVSDIYYWETYATDIVKLEHEKTGSVLYWLANDNIDRSYMMAFNTPINDNTGMPHVFEHATLGGSEKYPGANTFFEMTSKTSNTFLNAMTGQYYTMYPMASTSEEQLLKYVDFYMNGLTHPLAIENPYALMREAYRYELDDADGEIELQGVVYSEMLGALSQSRWANYNFNRMLWPNSYVTTVSGGDPDYIPELTLESVKAFHDRYYHPSNATMYLTGDVDLPRFLELLDTEFLSQYDREEIVIEDSNYTPLEPGRYEQTFSVPVETGTPTDKAAIIKYGLPFEASDYIDMEVLDLVCQYMNDESSPLQRMMKERLPEADASMTTSWDPEGKVAIVFTANSIDEADKDTFKDICDEALAALLDEGVNEEVLHGMIVSKKFSDLMSLDSSTVYLNIAQTMAVYWTIFGDRDAWKLMADFESHMTDYMTVENLNETARKYWSDLDTEVIAVTVPAPGAKEEKDAALRAQLDEMKAAMTPEEVDALVEQTKAFNAFVEESNAITMPEELNALSVETLPEETSYKKASETTVNGIRVITSEIDSPLIRVNILTDTSAIPFEDLFDFIEYTSMLGVLGTDLYTREELPAKMAAVSTGMGMYNNNEEDMETRELKDYFYAGWFALPETLEDSFALVEDILYHTDFSDYDYIRADAAQNYAQNQMYMDSNGLSYAILASVSNFSKEAKLAYYTSTEAQMDYWNKLSKYTDEEMDALVAKFEGFRDIILNRNDAILVVMGNSENIIRSTALGYALIDKFDDTVREGFDYAAMIPDLPLHTAIVTGGNVVFNIAAADLEAAGYDGKDGGIGVVQKVIDDKLLYPELRVKNSAYGGYSGNYNDYTLVFYSYRDPKVAETFDVYASAGDFLRGLEISESELAGYITSVYGDLTYPMGPLSAAMVGINDLLNGEDSLETTLKMIRDIKAFKPDDIAKYADLADAMTSDTAARVTAGTKSMIEANAGLYDYINYNLLDAEAAAADEAAGELLDVIADLSAEEIAEMAANMDEDDLNALVGYVMNYFTDPNTGEVDYDDVFEMVGEFLETGWTEDMAEAAEDRLEEAGAVPADEQAAEDAAEEAGEADLWASVWDSVFMGLDEENIMSWVESMQTGAEEGYEKALESSEELSNLLEGIFGAFIGTSAE
ncbi:MAG: insulinase family protein [Flexilinea sp.]|nr:insulinase family protein [Flexilinea sp.]